MNTKTKLTLLGLFWFILLNMQVLGQFNYGFYPKDPKQSEIFHLIKTDHYIYARAEQVGNKDCNIYIKMDLKGNILKKKVFTDTFMYPFMVYYSSFKKVGNKIMHAGIISDSVEKARFIQLDTNLNLVYMRTYLPSEIVPGASRCQFWDFQMTPDKGFIFIGQYTLNNGASTYYPFMMKTDKWGNIQWKQIYDRVPFALTVFYKMELTPDLGIILITSRNHGTIIKTNALGVIQWQKSMGCDSLYMHPADIAYLGNNEWVVGTSYMINYTGYSIDEGLYIIKINSLTGNISWKKKYNSYYSIDDYHRFKILAHPNGNFSLAATAYITVYVPSYNNYQYFYSGTLIHYNSQGDSIGFTGLYIDSILPNNDIDFQLDDIILLDNGYYLGAGSFYYYMNASMAWIFSTGPIPPPAAINTSQNSNSFHLYPNPSNGVFTMDFENKQDIKQIKVYNSLGQNIKNFQSLQGVKSYKINLSDQAKGLYFIGVESGNNVRFTKLVLE